MPTARRRGLGLGLVIAAGGACSSGPPARPAVAAFAEYQEPLLQELGDVMAEAGASSSAADARRPCLAAADVVARMREGPRSGDGRLDALFAEALEAYADGYAACSAGTVAGLADATPRIRYGSASLEAATARLRALRP